MKCEKVLEDNYDNDGKPIVWYPPAVVSTPLQNWARQELAGMSGPFVKVDRKTLGDWLGNLGILTAGTMSSEEARLKIGAYSSLLDERPSREFTKKSLEYVASRCKFFPSYAEIAKYLGEWNELQDKKRERLRVIAEPKKSESRSGNEPVRTAEEQERGEVWFAWAQAEVFGKYRPDLMGVPGHRLVDMAYDWAKRTGWKRGSANTGVASVLRKMA